MNNNHIRNNKEELILKYIVPALGLTPEKDEILIDELHLHSRLHTIIKSQFLETPGDWGDGHIWFSIDAMVHSYYTCQDTHENCGRQIWKKQEFIFDSQSFYDRQYRSDYIQAIEPGTFISIPYPELNSLDEHFSIIKQRLVQLSRVQQRYYRHHVQLLNKPPLKKVGSFIAMHTLFARVANNTINGMHTGLSRQGYEIQLKKLK
jgi:hypothetical protein